MKVDIPIFRYGTIEIPMFFLTLNHPTSNKKTHANLKTRICLKTTSWKFIREPSQLENNKPASHLALEVLTHFCVHIQVNSVFYWLKTLQKKKTCPNEMFSQLHYIVTSKWTGAHTVDGRNPANQFIGCLSYYLYYLQGFLYPRWLFGFFPSTVCWRNRRCDWDPNRSSSVQ